MLRDACQRMCRRSGAIARKLQLIAGRPSLSIGGREVYNLTANAVEGWKGEGTTGLNWTVPVPLCLPLSLPPFSLSIHLSLPPASGAGCNQFPKPNAF